MKKGNCVALTFDDGLLDLYENVFPYLGEKHIPFTAFIVTDFLDKPGYITKKQLVEMAKNPLVTIGSHGISHKLLTTMPRKEILQESITSQAILQDIIGKEVDYFAYSHGQINYNDIDLFKTYRFCYIASGGFNNFISGRNKYLIPRINIID